MPNHVSKTERLYQWQGRILFYHHEKIITEKDNSQQKKIVTRITSWMETTVVDDPKYYYYSWHTQDEAILKTGIEKNYDPILRK